MAKKSVTLKGKLRKRNWKKGKHLDMYISKGKLTRKNMVKSQVLHNNHKGGQVTTLDNIDLDQLKISKHVNINWQGLPSGPPTDCNIL
jgi:hypothetical protein